jgi:hypothetical protein
MTDLPIHRQIPLYEVADNRHQASAPIDRQIRPSDALLLPVHRASPSIG